MKNPIPFLYLSILAVFLTACRTPQFHPRHDLSEEQKALIDKYIRFKLKLTLGLGLDQRDDWDRDIRPKLAEALGFRKDEEDWERILAHPQVREILTPEKKAVFVKAFGLGGNTDWEAIKNAVEKAMGWQ